MTMSFLTSVAVTVIGLIVVFTILLILCVIAGNVKWLDKLGFKKKEEEEEKQQPQTSAPAVPAAADDTELAAVIAAAIAAYTETTGNSGSLYVRSIRRISPNTSAWNRAGRNEQILNRF